MTGEVWSLDPDQRGEVRSRAAAGLSTLAFSRGVSLDDNEAHKAAESLEKRAYTAAEVQAVTTTGARPKDEVTRAYSRKLGELICEFVLEGGAANQTVTKSKTGKTLDLSGTREFLTKSLAEELLRPLLDASSAIEKIVFSMKSFGTDAANVAAEGLENVTATLKSADISDIIAGRPESEALEVLRIISGALAKANLRDLNLSDNALGEKGIRACSAVLTSQKSLETLALRNVGCSINACKAVEELVCSTALKGLFLFNNMSGDEGAELIGKILQRAGSVEMFQMGSSRVGAEGGLALTRGLCAGTSLVSLDLSDNPMTEEVAKGLADVVARHPGLKRLNLNDTSLGDAGVCLLAGALSGGSPNLEVLELALNEITAESAVRVSVALLGMPNLKRLNLRENELEDAGAVLIGRAISLNKNLEEIDLVMNMIGRIGALKVAGALKGKPNFKKLELDENQISEDGITALKETVRSIFDHEDVLASLDENDADVAEDDDEPASCDVDEDDELSKALAKLNLG